MNLSAEISIKGQFYRTFELPMNGNTQDPFYIEIPECDIRNQSPKEISPELQSIQDILKGGVHNLRKTKGISDVLADAIEAGDFSIRLKDNNGIFYKMIQILDIHFGLDPKHVDFFECDVDTRVFGYYLLCTIEPMQEKSAILITFQKITDPISLQSILYYREHRDLRVLDVGSGICLNVKNLPPDTDSEEDNFEVGQLILLERLFSKIQRHRISKKHRRRYYILGEKIFRELQKIR